MKCAAVKTDNVEQKEQQIQKLKEETGFDEIVIGCFFANYKVKHVCPIATGGWCRDYVKCKCIEEGIERKIKMQQANNEKIAGEKKGNRLKTALLYALLAFIFLLDITLVISILKLIIFGEVFVTADNIMTMLIIYLVISLIAAGFIYLQMWKENNKCQRK